MRPHARRAAPELLGTHLSSPSPQLAPGGAWERGWLTDWLTGRPSSLAPACAAAGTEVAWNQVRVMELATTKEERDRLFAEIRVLRALKHKNIMSFYHYWHDEKSQTINFITELFTSGTLRQ